MGIWDIFRQGSDAEVEALRKENSDLRQKNDLLMPDFGMQAMGDSNQNPFMQAILKQDKSDYKMMHHKPPTTRISTVTSNGGRIPLNPFPLPYLYQIAKNVDAVRIPVDVLNKEIHRGGFHVEPRFRLKCQKCKKEFDDLPIEESEEPECDVCGNKGEKNFDKPDPDQRKIVAKLITEPQNEYDQKFMQISKQVERDLDIADDAYLILMRDYDVESRKVARSRIVAKEVISPMISFPISDRQGRMGVNDNGKRVFVCPMATHRNTVIIQNGDEVPRCTRCGCEGLPAYLEVTNGYGAVHGGNTSIVYAKDEVLKIPSKFWEDPIAGYSIIYTIISKATTLFHMDEYFRKFFDKMRPPRGALFVSTSNRLSLKKSFDEMYAASKRDPYMIYPIMVENERGNRNFVQYVNFAGNMQDLQLDKVRDEFKRVIGAMYGIMPLFSGDLESGGMSQESLQTMVVNRRVSADQDLLEETFYTPLLKILGVTDWVLKLKAVEETDLMREEQLFYQQAINAKVMQEMGFEIELDGNGSFVYSDKPVNRDQQQPASGGTFGGPGGSGGPAGVPRPNQGNAGTTSTGSHAGARPSDMGGQATGHPAAGRNTSRTQKSFRVKKSKELTYYDVLAKWGTTVVHEVDRFEPEPGEEPDKDGYYWRSTKTGRKFRIKARQSYIVAMEEAGIPVRDALSGYTSGREKPEKPKEPEEPKKITLEEFRARADKLEKSTKNHWSMLEHTTTAKISAEHRAILKGAYQNAPRVHTKGLRMMQFSATKDPIDASGGWYNRIDRKIKIYDAIDAVGIKSVFRHELSHHVYAQIRIEEELKEWRETSKVLYRKHGMGPTRYCDSKHKPLAKKYQKIVDRINKSLKTGKFHVDDLDPDAAYYRQSIKKIEKVIKNNPSMAESYSGKIKYHQDNLKAIMDDIEVMSDEKKREIVTKRRDNHLKREQFEDIFFNECHSDVAAFIYEEKEMRKRAAFSTKGWDRKINEAAMKDWVELYMRVFKH